MPEPRWIPAACLAAVLLLAGCPITINVPVPPGSSPAATSKPGPASADATPGERDTAKPAASAKPNAKASGAPAAQCTQAGPAAAGTPGRERHGRYRDQLLPAGWDALADERGVTTAIAKIEAGAATDWACFQKFYSGAVTVYSGLKDASPSAQEACASFVLAGPTSVGQTWHGAYNGLTLPGQWSETYVDEADITRQIRLFDNEADWPCFEKLFPAAARAFKEARVGRLCTRDAPPAAPIKGQAKHGAYNNQMLPSGWDNLADEKAVTEAIRKVLQGPDAACFEKFYPGAFTVYKGRE